MRKPYQGVMNIIRFNWHFYLIASALVLFFFFLKSLGVFSIIVSSAVLLSCVISLFVSFYIYDLSGLYYLKYIESNGNESTILNIHAGFDETSEEIILKFPEATLTVLDFYDASKHTELSIERARKQYPPFPNTMKTLTTHIPFGNHYFDKIFVIFSAHEIRNIQERIDFFRELNRILKLNGEIYVTEHLRDFPNFLAYTIGVFHFYSRRTWIALFSNAHLSLIKESKITPFITNFTLTKHGTTT